VCPRGDIGKIYLDGTRKSKDGRFERTRWRCIPESDYGYIRERKHGPNEHVFTVPMSPRREARGGAECAHCERPFARAEGLAGPAHFSTVVQEIADGMISVGAGTSYRRISRRVRAAVGRVSTRGKRKGSLALNGALAMDYTDVFAPDLIAAHSPKSWPPIIAIDSFPILVRDHSECCPDRIASGGVRRTRHPGPDAPRNASGYLRPRLITHEAPLKETGHILVAVGYDHAGAFPRPWLIRFAGGRDQESWVEFLRMLPGTPEWIVSDRDRAIKGAVADLWGDKPTTYFCEQHIANNAAEAAILDKLDPHAGVLKEILEQAQYGPEELGKLEGAAVAFGGTKLQEWLVANRDEIIGQLAKREGKPLHPRSASACEDAIRSVKAAVADRTQYFANADRLNLLLGLVRNNLVDVATLTSYSRTIRAKLAQTDGRLEANWGEIRDPDGFIGSMEMLLADAAIRSREAQAQRDAPKKAERYQRRKQIQDAERVILGLPVGRRPKVQREMPGSVAGKFVADFPWLMAQWDFTKNTGLEPETLPAGSGSSVWWVCFEATDHSWQAQVRSRSIRGAGCPFCTHRRVAPSESIARTYPDIAAQWHPTRNGDKLPTDFTYGSTKEAWWQCPTYKSHVWKARIASRTSGMGGCPDCYRLARKGQPAEATPESKTA
jgi:hypothetical protein